MTSVITFPATSQLTEADLVTSSPRHLVTSSPRHLVTSSPRHLVTLSLVFPAPSDLN